MTLEQTDPLENKEVDSLKGKKEVLKWGTGIWFISNILFTKPFLHYMISDAYTIVILIIGNIRESHFLCTNIPYTSKPLKPNP